MRWILPGMLCITGIFFIDCSSMFPTSYDRIDAERLRILDYVYEPAEAAPGEVVKVYAIFAGACDLLNPSDIDWKVSYNVLSNNGGVDTALDIQKLAIQSISMYHFSENTCCFMIQFRIPDSVVFKSVSIPPQWTSLIPAQYQSEIPDFIKSMNRNDLISITQGIAKRAKTWGKLLTNNPGAEDSLLQADSMYSLYKNNLKKYMPAIVQFLTIKIRLLSEIKGVLKVRSTYSVRYNNCFKDIQGSRVFINQNPVIDSIGIYKVNEENIQIFNPEDGKHEYEFIRLLGKIDSFPDSMKTIEIDRNCSYFVAAFTAEPDSSMTIQSILQNGLSTEEELATQWYFQLSEKEIADVSPYDFMSIKGKGAFIEVLNPPADENVRTFILWLEVKDHLDDEINRPQGSTLKEVKGRFKYR